jgi:microcystin-dependent protein
MVDTGARWNEPQGVGELVRASERHRRARPKRNPCDAPPGKPDLLEDGGTNMRFQLRYQVREARTHLEYFAYATFREAVVDEDNIPLTKGRIDRYRVQLKVTTDAAGDVPAFEDDRSPNPDPIRWDKTINVDQDNRDQVIEVTGANGGTFRLTYDGQQTSALNHNATASQIESALEALSNLDAGDVSCSGGPLGNNPVTVAFENQGAKTLLVVSVNNLTGPNPGISIIGRDRYNVYFGHIPRPKKLYASARIKVRAGKGCWSDWSDWTDPEHPFQGESDPEPPVPANLDLDFDHEHSSRHDPLRAIVSGDYVGPWDVPGGDTEDDMDHYVIQLQFSNDGGTTAHWPPRQHSKVDRDDNDGRWRSVFHNVDRRKLYRFRVRSVDRFRRRGDWGPGAPNVNGRLDGWSAWVDPKTFDENPPAPSFVGADIDRNRLTVEIQPYGAQWSGKIDYYEWEVYYDAVGGTPHAKDRFHRGLTKHFALRKPEGHTVIARVRSYTASDEVSPWAEITAAPHVPPTPSISSTSFDTRGTRHARYRALIGVSVVDAGHNDTIKTILVQFVHKPASATPVPSDVREVRRVNPNDDSPTAIFKNIPKRHFCYARARTRDDDGKESPWSSWTSMGRPVDSGASSTPTAVTGLSVTKPVPRRLVGNWDDPDDDETTRWQVEVLRGATPMETRIVRQPRFAYRVPAGDVGILHSMRITPMNDLGNSGSPVTDDETPDDDTAGGSEWEVGDIKKRGRTTIPPKWLRCNGDSYATSAYPELFAVIGYFYGGSGANFNVPDLKGRHALGDSVNFAMGANEGEVEANRLAGHLHDPDETESTPVTDETETQPTDDVTATTPDTDATGATPTNDSTQAQNPTDATSEGQTHTHSGSGLITNASNDNSPVQAGGGASRATQGHGHDVIGSTQGQSGTHGHSHPHNPHPHNHGHGTHPHSHSHNSHKHGHNHGKHKHGHNHGKHKHGHQHPNKNRPHLAVRYIIKALP